ncbi:MAG: arginine-specific cysteine proteinase [Candidatus Ozemobacter sibiricus]|jgi:hypothetical protein|uniref:Arginine-specific cysteine proteinase n=1 Tax=Candidatus Ozemobacter sibiricus TaxID=2268124 RepID=A0A367ZQD7_9BACT|nr:MAG: arginine-specific cysteine proteinase [Candidatus Ozemobacter sibiricus]
MKRWNVALICVLLVQVAMGAWAEFSVRVDRSSVTEISVTFPTLLFARLTIDGKPAYALAAEGSSLTQNKGAPELPYQAGFMMVSPTGKPTLEILDRKFEVIDLDARVRPSKGPLSRAVDPQQVPYEFGKAYGVNAWIPSDAEVACISAPFIYRDVRGVRLTVSAVQYNPVTNQLRVYKSLRAKLSSSGTGPNPHRGRPMVTRVFEPSYRRFFRNFQPMAQRLPRLGENGRLLIIAADELYEAVLPLHIWKLKCGIETKTVRLSDIGGATPEAIKAFLQAEYDGRGFTHVILVGDAAQVPTNKGANERADSDPCYVKLAGDDHVPDAIISRISATTPEEVAYQVAKFINYERFPSEGEDTAWYLRAMGIASGEGNPADFEIMSDLRSTLLKAARFTAIDEIYDPKVTHNGGGFGGGGGDYPPYPGGPFGPWGGGWGPWGGGLPHLPPMIMAADRRSETEATATATPAPASASVTAPPPKPKANKADVAKGVNEGRCLINYLGHGSKDAWVTSGFATADCRALTNGWKLPLIISVACVNGNFVNGADCFAEAWLKAGNIENPAGAVGFFGSTTNQDWVPPITVQKEINLEYLMNDTYKTAGALVMNGIMKGLEQYGTEVKSPGVKMAEQWHWFGDATTLIRTRPPISAKIDVQPSSNETECQAAFTVLTADGKPVADAHVTFYTEKFELWVTGRTSDTGQVTLKIPAPKGTKGYYTVIGSLLVPQVDEPISF